MIWYKEAIFYHIYPLGLTGAPKENHYEKPVHRLNSLIPWISHIKEIGCNAIYIGPLFESVGHGYETTDYKKLDSRLGTNEDLKNFVKECHRQEIRVIFDGVFNHTGRDFFAFRDIQEKREGSAYKDWYCNVNFWGNTEYQDGFSYDNWGGYNLLAKLNQHNPQVREYICDIIRFWVTEFDVDGIRLDTADVLDFSYMQTMRQVANEIKPDFWLMGEVIHGDYTRWVNQGTLHSVTNYHLHKALYSAHNDHNFFEIAHTVRRQWEMGLNRPDGMQLYNFADNHDVERIYTKLYEKAHFVPVHILLYTLPGIPSIYYGSEFGIEGRKERGSDDSLRPALRLADFADAEEKNPCTRLIAALGRARKGIKALSYGGYRELYLTTRQYAFERSCEDSTAVITVNNDENACTMTIEAGNASEYIGILSGARIKAADGRLTVEVEGNSGEIWIPYGREDWVHPGKCMEETSVRRSEVPESLQQKRPIFAWETVWDAENGNPEVSTKKTKVEIKDDTAEKEAVCHKKTEEVPKRIIPGNKPYEDMSVEELQAVVLEKLGKNGLVTQRMQREVAENIYHDSLVNWAKSFR